ncbi:MAG: tachylectin-related carbohydrate-binding protein [Pseudomonadota bacterium]
MNRKAFASTLIAVRSGMPMGVKRASLVALLAGFLALAVLSLPAQARDRPGTPNKGFAANCGYIETAEPAICVEFMNTATEKVGFLMDWTENGTHMSSDLSGRAECITRSAQNYGCMALPWWFSGNTNLKPVTAARFNSQREFPEAFKIKGLLWDAEYCFRFRAIDEDGVISALYSGFTCAHTPAAPGPPGALDPPKLTGIRPSSGEGVIGGATPFKLLVEWHSSPRSSANLGWYAVELWSGTQWLPIEKLDPARAPDPVNLELLVTHSKFGNGDDRQAVRVCALNVVARTCSRESWYYGSLKPKQTAVSELKRLQGVARPGVSTTVSRNPAAQVLLPPGPVSPAISATARPSAYAAVGATDASPQPQPAPAPASSIFYAVDASGALLRYVHDTPEGGTTPDKSLAAAEGWSAYTDVIPAGGNHFYARTGAGDLVWFQHSPNDDPANAWKGPVVVARGWQTFTQIIGGGNGVIYAIAADGAIVWYRHGGFATGDPGGWVGPNKLADGWGDFKFIFSSGGGVIYTVTQDNRLMSNRHLDPVNGAAAWGKPVQVGNGWGAFAQLFSAGNGVIYGLATDGKLTYYRHLSWNAPAPTFKWVGPVAAGDGFDPAAKLVALLR